MKELDNLWPGLKKSFVGSGGGGSDGKALEYIKSNKVVVVAKW